jgi:hypothetical protein
MTCSGKKTPKTWIVGLKNIISLQMRPCPETCGLHWSQQWRIRTKLCTLSENWILGSFLRKWCHLALPMLRSCCKLCMWLSLKTTCITAKCALHTAMNNYWYLQCITVNCNLLLALCTYTFKILYCWLHIFYKKPK